MLNTNHTGRDVNSINTTNIDIWCSNTFMQALKDKDQFFIKLSHRVEYNDQVESMVINKVNEALKFNEEYKEQAQALDTKQLTEREMRALAELLEGADELISQRDYILKLIN